MKEYISQTLDFISYKNGVGIKGVREYYYASPSNNKNSAGLPSNVADWAQSPAGTQEQPFNETNKYLWNCEQVEYDNGDFGEVTDAAVIAVWSKDGKGIKNITEWYYLTATSTEKLPTLPTRGGNGEWGNTEWERDVQIPSESYRYLWNYEIIEYTEGNPTTVGPACIAVHGEKGRDAVSALAISLSNDSDLIPANADGVVDTETALGGAKTSVVAFVNGVAVANSFPTCVVKANGATITSGYAYSNGEFQLTNWQNEIKDAQGNITTAAWNSVVATFTFSTTIEEQTQTITKDFVMTKMPAEKGEQGDAAVDYELQVTPQVVNLSLDSNPNITAKVIKSVGSVLTEITTGIQYRNTSNGWTTLGSADVKWNSIGTPKQFRYGITSGNTTIYEYEEVTVVQNGTSPYSIQLDNDSATITTDKNGTVDSTTLQRATTTTVHVYKGTDEITSDLTYTWTLSPSGASNTALNGTTLKTIYFTALGVDTITATVEVKYKGDPIGTKSFTVSKSKTGATGEPATSYSLIITPNQWNLTDSLSITPDVQIVKYIGDTSVSLVMLYDGTNQFTKFTVENNKTSTGTEYNYKWENIKPSVKIGDYVFYNGYCYPIVASGIGLYAYERFESEAIVKANGEEWQVGIGNKIAETTIFELYIDDIKLDSETVTAVKNGENSTVPGPQGYSGATLVLYKRSSSIPTGNAAKPSGSLTYNFKEEELTGNYFNGWSTGVPSGSNTCYAIYAYASSNTSTDTIGKDEWSVPIVIEGKDGDNGINTATVFLYQRAASIPSKPSSLSYDFTTGVLSGTLGNWSQIIPAANGNPCYFIQEVVVSKETTKTITSSDWSNPEIYNKDGTQGTSTESVYAYYLTCDKLEEGKPLGIPNTESMGVPDENIGNTDTTQRWTLKELNITDSYKYLYRCTGTKETNYTTGTETVKYIWNKDSITLIQADIPGDLDTYNTFLKLTNQGTKDYYGYDENGDLFINATYIKSGEMNADLIQTGSLEVQKEGKVILSAAFSGDNAGTVNMAGFEVTDGSLKQKNGKFEINSDIANTALGYHGLELPWVMAGGYNYAGLHRWTRDDGESIPKGRLLGIAQNILLYIEYTITRKSLSTMNSDWQFSLPKAITIADREVPLTRVVYRSFYKAQIGSGSSGGAYHSAIQTATGEWTCSIANRYNASYDVDNPDWYYLSSVDIQCEIDWAFLYTSATSAQELDHLLLPSQIQVTPGATAATVSYTTKHGSAGQYTYVTDSNALNPFMLQDGSILAPGATLSTVLQVAGIEFSMNGIKDTRANSQTKDQVITWNALFDALGTNTYSIE